MEFTRSYKNYTAKWTFVRVPCGLPDQFDCDSTSEEYESKSEDSSEAEFTAIKVDFYKNDVYLYSLFKNDYKTESDDDNEMMMLEYFERADGNVVHLFNLEHSIISVVDANTGKEIHHDDIFDTFITNYALLDNREYMYVCGYIWGPFAVRYIYHIPSFLETSNYEPIVIPCPNDFEDCNINLYGCKSCKEFIDKKDAIFANIFLQKTTKKFNKNRCKDILLRRFLNDDSVLFIGSAKSKLRALLDTEQTNFKTEVWGNRSGTRLKSYEDSLYREIDQRFKFPNVKQDEMSLLYLCSKMFIQYAKNLPFPVYDIRFDLHYENSQKLMINFYQELTWNNKYTQTNGVDVKRYNVDPAKPCKITVS